MRTNLFIGIQRTLFTQSISAREKTYVNFKKTTPTIENQYELLSKTMEPYCNLPYEEQLKIKYKKNEISLKKVANSLKDTFPRRQFPPDLKQIVTENNGMLCPLDPVVPSPVINEYRSKEVMSLGKGLDGNTLAGLHVGKGRKNVPSFCVNIDHLNTVRKSHIRAAKAYQNFVQQSKFPPLLKFSDGGHWRSMTLRSNLTGELLVSITFHPQGNPMEFAECGRDEVREYFMNGPGRKECNITSLFFQICHHFRCLDQCPHQHVFGPLHIFEEIWDLKFRISPSSFFQINVPCAEILYETIRKMAGVGKNTVLLDVCCGTGTIGQTMARHVKKVIGIERIKEAIEDAQFNATLNGLSNTHYICGHAEDILKNLMTDGTFHEDEDIVAVLNPSRSGLGKKLLNALRCCKAVRRVIYVSCKPYGRPAQNFVKLCQEPNEKKISGDPFTLKKAVPVDMFPHTKHCEMILLFER